MEGRISSNTTRISGELGGWELSWSQPLNVCVHSQNKQHALTISKQEAKQWQAKVIENMSHIVAVLRYMFLSDSRITNRKIAGGEEVSPLSSCVDTSPDDANFHVQLLHLQGSTVHSTDQHDQHFRFVVRRFLTGLGNRIRLLPQAAAEPSWNLCFSQGCLGRSVGWCSYLQSVHCATFAADHCFFTRVLTNLFRNASDTVWVVFSAVTFR